MTGVLGISVPSYPRPDKKESAFLYCSNFLLQREQQTGIYYESEDLIPLEQLMDTIWTLQLRKRAIGDAIQSGDLIVIFQGNKVVQNIIHAVIALNKSTWYGAGNKSFFSHILRKPIELMRDRDAISTWGLHVDIHTYSFGPYCFDVWCS